MTDHTGTDDASCPLTQALRTALALERRVRDLYRSHIPPSEDAPGYEFYQLMADEEQHHVVFLEKTLEAWLNGAVVEGAELASTLPSLDAFDRSDTVHGEAGADELSDELRDELRILTEALRLEEEAGKFYEDVVSTLPEERRELFFPFLEIEAGHRAFVQFQIDMVTSLGTYARLPRNDGRRTR